MKYSYNDKKSLKKVIKVLKSGKVNYWTGNENILFEKQFSNYIGNKYSVAVSNGSVALEIALRSLNLKSNNEVLVSPRSFIISASCVLNVGLKPIFTDVNNNGNMSIDGILKAYNKNIKAIILVHLNGLSCDLDPILKFAKKNKLYMPKKLNHKNASVQNLEEHKVKFSIVIFLMRLILRFLGPLKFYNFSRLLVYLSSPRQVKDLWKL